jgi:aarF domain-containing kinase
MYKLVVSRVLFVLQMREEWAGVLDEWALRFFQEMDYQLEAFNTVTFKRQMAHLEGTSIDPAGPS